MKKKSLIILINKEIRQKYSARIHNKEAELALYDLFNAITDILSDRIDDIELFEDKALMFFSSGREIIRVNIGRHNMRVYIHPPAGALFKPDAKFDVEKINLWQSAFRKTSGKYCGMTFWVANRKHIEGARKIIEFIPKA